MNTRALIHRLINTLIDTMTDNRRVGRTLGWTVPGALLLVLAIAGCSSSAGVAQDVSPTTEHSVASATPVTPSTPTNVPVVSPSPTRQQEPATLAPTLTSMPPTATSAHRRPARHAYANAAPFGDSDRDTRANAHPAAFDPGRLLHAAFLVA